MADFSDIQEQYNQIKDTPEVIEQTRISDLSKNTGKAADRVDLRQDILPDAETHARLQDDYEQMFDKTRRSGAKSTLHGLVLPGGRKMFSEFHNNFTGTGRFKPQKAPDRVQLPTRSPQIQTKGPSVVLYERCMDCLERVDKDEAVPNITFLPPGDLMNDIAKSKWSAIRN